MDHSIVDLHIHTTTSDGELSPEEVVHDAAAAGLRVIAITDHDAVGAIEPARRAAHGTNVQVLAGVELSGMVQDRAPHLLGYGFDPASGSLAAGLRELAERREGRARAMLMLLADMGMPLAWSSVVGHAGGTIGRPHIARALVESGYVVDVRDAFDRLIGAGQPAYIPSASFTAADVVALVRDAGGEVAVAHPASGSRTLDLRVLLPDLRQAGVTGIEVYHTSHDLSTVESLRVLADREGMWWSGGSDYHGPNRPPARLGGVTVPSEVLDQGPFRALPLLRESHRG